MNKVLKKQKLVIKLIIIILIVFGFKPFLQQIEMWRDSKNQLHKEYIAVYFKATKKVVIPPDIDVSKIITYDGFQPQSIELTKDLIDIAGMRQDGSECLAWQWSNCLPKDSYTLLNTDLDQGVIRNTFNKKMNYLSSKDTLIFKDFNLDGIDDIYLQLRCHKICDYGEAESYLYSIYSIHDNRLLWGFSRDIIAIDGNFPDAQFIENNTNFPTVVIFTPSSSLFGQNNYDFFKYFNKSYKLIEPSRKDWSDYWKEISFGNLFYMATYGMMFIGILVVLLPGILLILGVVLTVKMVQTIRRKITQKSTHFKSG